MNLAHKGYLKPLALTSVTSTNYSKPYPDSSTTPLGPSLIRESVSTM